MRFWKVPVKRHRRIAKLLGVAPEFVSFFCHWQVCFLKIDPHQQVCSFDFPPDGDLIYVVAEQFSCQSEIQMNDSGELYLSVVFVIQVYDGRKRMKKTFVRTWTNSSDMQGLQFPLLPGASVCATF